jgi:peptidoglycan/LPS O-acetylase OafA/YrhL
MSVTNGCAKNRIGALDGWRGVAILFVIVDHLGESSHGVLHAATRVGASGVGLFFALSGFLITSLLLSEDAKNGRVSLSGFYQRRAFRILPPVLAFLGVLISLRLAGMLEITKEQVLSTIFLFRNYIPTDWKIGWYTGHMWSLMVEEHFYLIWPMLLNWDAKKHKGSRSLSYNDSLVARTGAPV